MIRVLITCGGGFQGLGLVRALHAAGGIRTFVCDMHPDNPVRYVAHHYLVCPLLADDDAYESFLRDTVARERIDFVFPATALDLRVLAGLHAELQSCGVTLAICRQPLLDRLLDKSSVQKLLTGAGLPAAQSIDPHQHDFSFPLIGKLADSWGGRGLEMIDSRESRDRRFASIRAKHYVWSRYFNRFEEYSADFAIGSSGTLSPIVVRKRLRTSGGFAVISESAGEPGWQALFSKVAQALADAGGYGLFNAQAIDPGSETALPFVSDINPRIGTSATHGLAEGINLPAWFIGSVRGHAPEAPRLRRHTKSIRLLSDMALPVLPQRPRAVVFDLDDTLVDHKRWLLAKMQALYDACFLDLADGDSYLRVAVQLIDDHEWPRLIDRTLELLDLPTTLRERAIEAYRAIEISDTPLYDDVEPVLSALREAGIKAAILTDNPPATQRSKIAHAPPLRDIETVVLSRECGGEKPRLSAFDQMARALELPPDQLVMAGDNWMRDGAGALRAGYAHAFIVRRSGSGTLASRWLVEELAAIQSSGRISAVPGLVAILHACLDAPA